MSENNTDVINNDARTKFDANFQDSDSDKSEIIECKKPKRQMSEKQKLNLQKGRDALKAKKEQQLKDKADYMEKMAIKKTNNIIKTKNNIKKTMGLNEDTDSEREEPIVQVKEKKKKKKQVVYLSSESDSEEEIIYKKKPKDKVKPDARTIQEQTKQIYPSSQSNQPKLIFM